jgi:UDP-N-acetylmuramyl pentapeptide phosphotransferase/UDP-N-acetylglucosamine-1-phosphate transferase
MGSSSSLGWLAAEMWLASALGAGIVATFLVQMCVRAKESAPTDPQHIHVEPTSRLGGVAVFLGFEVAVAIALHFKLIPLHPTAYLLMAALPLVVVGLCEDITRRVSPKHRLLAAVCSAALASAFADGVVARVDLPFIDGWLKHLPFALPLTFLMVAGACNAVNIIDGTHGLAGGSALLMFVGLATVAWDVGDMPVLAQGAAMTGALLGFLLWNYPRGKVFLGDAGAYFIGFVYAQLSIQLVVRNPGVSAWFVIALAAYPIVETLFSMYRRKILHRTRAMQPDIQHLHSLLYRCLLRSAERPPHEERRSGLGVTPYLGRERRQAQRRANPQVAPRMWLHGVLCLAIALLFYNSTPILLGFTLIYGVFYLDCYRDVERRLGDHAPTRSRIPLPARERSAAAQGRNVA